VQSVGDGGLHVMAWQGFMEGEGFGNVAGQLAHVVQIDVEDAWPAADAGRDLVEGQPCGFFPVPLLASMLRLL
jgi:hypothetical protein